MQCLGGSPGHCTSQHRPAPALHMLNFANFVKSMPPSLSELKVTPSFCFAFKIPDNVTASKQHSDLNIVVIVYNRLRSLTPINISWQNLIFYVILLTGKTHFFFDFLEKIICNVLEHCEKSWCLARGDRDNHRKNSNSSTTATTVTKTREEMESWGSQETPWGENISEVI